MPIKRVIAVLGALLMVVVALPTVVVLWRNEVINSAPVREQIGDAVQELTGRQATLGGRIDLDEFPWIGVVIGPGELANPPGFDGPPLLAWDEIRLRVHYSSLHAASPLLDPLVVSGLKVRLRRDARGRDNWSDLGSRVDSGPPLAALTLPRIELRDLLVSYTDETTSQRPLAELSEALLTIDDIRRGAGRVEGARWRIASVELTGEGRARLPRAGSAGVELADSLKVRLKNIDLRVPDDADAAVSVAAATGSLGALQAELRPLRWTPTLLTTRLQVRAAALDELLQAVGIEPPFSSTPQQLQLRQLRAQLRRGKDGTLRVTNLDLGVDDTRIRGELRLGELVALALEVDSIDADRYAAALNKPAGGAQPASESPGRMLQTVPTMLQALPIAGTVRIDQLRTQGAVLAGVTLRLESRPQTAEPSTR